MCSLKAFVRFYWILWTMRLVLNASWSSIPGMSGGRSFQSLMAITKKLCFRWSPVDPILTNLLGWYCRVVLVGFCKYGDNGMATFWWVMLWKTSRRDVLRLSWSAWSSSSCRIGVTIPGSVEYSCLIYRAAVFVPFLFGIHVYVFVDADPIHYWRTQGAVLQGWVVDNRS